jgi:hypothetical protein
MSVDGGLFWKGPAKEERAKEEVNMIKVLYMHI